MGGIVNVERVAVHGLGARSEHHTQWQLLLQVQYQSKFSYAIGAWSRLVTTPRPCSQAPLLKDNEGKESLFTRGESGKRLSAQPNDE